MNSQIARSSHGTRVPRGSGVIVEHLGGLVIATVGFVGTHLLLSHPLRAPIAARTGEPAFLGLYSLVAIATFVWLVMAYVAVPAEPPLWNAGVAVWALVTLLMLLASVLLVGSLIGNPALPRAGSPGALPTAAKGVFSITRHPMNWAFALWGVSHIAVFPTLSNFILAGSIILLAVAGSALQDRKKEALQSDRWLAWEAMTSFWPFGAVITRRANLAGFGWAAPLGGLVVWLAATWAHGPLAGIAAGIWRWVAL